MEGGVIIKWKEVVHIDLLPLTEMVLLSSLNLACWASLLVFAWCREELCLQDGHHKSKPSPEPGLKECSLYKKNVRRSLKELSVFTAALLMSHTGHTLRVALPPGQCLYATASAEIGMKSVNQTSHVLETGAVTPEVSTAPAAAYLINR
ncbi:riboflavin-binding protein-like [Clarias magur]|uniref:Riboflavin-binding protein-like n=1 Tax=Clarias magur TaxID=1594786 RepID=A0A8J4UCI7_CLAMG|nr:riboflavin-binding protein-like [Clarias magur]